MKYLQDLCVVVVQLGVALDSQTVSAFSRCKSKMISRELHAVQRYAQAFAESGFQVSRQGPSASDSGHVFGRQYRTAFPDQLPKRKKFRRKRNRAEPRPGTRENSMWYEKSLRYPVATIPRPTTERQSFTRNKKYRPSGLTEITRYDKDEYSPFQAVERQKQRQRSARSPGIYRQRVSPLPVNHEEDDRSTLASSTHHDDLALIKDKDLHDAEKGKLRQASNNTDYIGSFANVWKTCCIVNLILSAGLFSCAIYVTVTNSEAIEQNKGQLDKINSYMVVSEDNIMTHYSKVIGEMQSNIKRSKTQENETAIKLKRYEQSILRIKDNIADLVQENERVEAEDRKTLQRFESEIDIINNEISGLSKNYDSVERKTETMATNIDEIELNIKEDAQEKENSRSKMDKFEVDIEQNRRSIHTMEVELSKINPKRVPTENNEFNEKDAQYDISELSDSVGMANDKINTVESMLTESQNAIERLKQDDEKITARVESLETQDGRHVDDNMLQPLRNDISTIQQDITNLLELETAAANERENLRSQVESIIQRPPQTSEDHPNPDVPKGIEHQIMENANTIQGVRENLDNANGKFEENRQEIIKIQQETNSLSLDMVDSKSRLQVLSGNVNDINVKVQALEDAVKDVKSVLDSVKDDRKKEVQAMAEKQEQMAKWRDLEKRYQNFGESFAGL